MELTCKKRAKQKKEGRKSVNKAKVDVSMKQFLELFLLPLFTEFFAHFFLCKFLHSACQNEFVIVAASKEVKATILIAAMPAINLSIKHILAFSARDAAAPLAHKLLPDFNSPAEDLHFAAFYFLIFLPFCQRFMLHCMPQSAAKTASPPPFSQDPPIHPHNQLL